MDLQTSLKALRSEFGVIASAVLSRDGLLIASDIPEGITAETFTIMCATMMGAASTAHSELKVGQPQVMKVQSKEHEMFVVGAGRRALMVSVAKRGVDADKLLKQLNTIIDMVDEGE